MTTTSDVPRTIGLLLAGGASARMGGGDKAQCKIAGRTLLDRVVTRLAPQCESLVLNSPAEPAHFSGLSLPVIGDSLPGRQGPLAGLLAGFDWIDANRPDVEWMLSAPVDCPFLPVDLASRLHAARAAEAPIAAAASNGRIHHVVALWHVSLQTDLRAALDQGVRKVEAFTKRHRCASVEWPSKPFDPFFNVNTPTDLAEAERLVMLTEET